MAKKKEAKPEEEEPQGLGIKCQKCGKEWAEWVDTTLENSKVCVGCIDRTTKLYTAKEGDRRKSLRDRGLDPDTKGITITEDE